MGDRKHQGEKCARDEDGIEKIEGNLAVSEELFNSGNGAGVVGVKGCDQKVY
jgi:hypothetical protein